MKTQPTKNSLWFISICIFSLILATQAWSDTYYVDALNGIEDNDGLTPATAWKTIEGSVFKLQDNDQLIVAPGTYTPVDIGGNGAVDVTQDGVTIQGAPGVVIDGGGGDPGWQYGIFISGSGVVLRDLEITRVMGDGAKAVYVQSGSNNRIESCIIHNNDDGIVFDIGSGTGNILEGCTIHNNSYGVDIQNADPQILGNTIYDNSRNINVYNSTSTKSPDIINNLVYRTVSGMYGIYVHAFNVAVQPRIYHNTIVAVDTGIHLIADEISGFNNADIQYNIITTNSSSGTGISYTSSYFTDFGGAIDYNDIWNNFTNYIGNDVSDGYRVSAGPNDFSSDPLFTSASDFHLQAGSPCRDHIPFSAGHPVDVDIGLLPRPQPPGGMFDVGAYEFPATLYDLTVSVAVGGSVTLNPPGGTYVDGTQVTLTPAPDTGWAFSQWGGDLSGSDNPTIITMDDDKNVVATFVLKNAPETPTAISPLDEGQESDGAVTLVASAFNDPDGDSHLASYWKVWRADTGEIIDDNRYTDLESHLIPATLTDGLKYYWEVKYEDSDLNASDWSETFAFKVGTPVPESLPAIAAGQDLGDFGMISIVHWPDDPSPQAVFNIDYDPVNYRIGTYDAMTGSYIEFGEGVEMEPGRAYWILAREGLTVNFDGIPVNTSDPVYVKLDYNETTLNGWNMVAPPNNADYYWANVTVVDSTLTPLGTVQSLTDGTIIDQALWSWENGYVPETPDDNPIMEAYAGYWVEAKQAGLFLKFDSAARVASLEMPETLLARAWHKTKTWLSNLNIFSQEAIADNDSPPMPPAALDENTVDPVFGGCYVRTLSD